MNSWGVLGNPTPQQISSWQNLPYGKFKTMVDDLKKKSKGKNLRVHAVEVKESNETTRRAYINVSAFDPEHAVTLAREINISELEWSEPKSEPVKLTYRTTHIIGK